MSTCEKCKQLMLLKDYRNQTENIVNNIAKLEKHRQIALHQLHAFQQDKCNLLPGK